MNFEIMKIESNSELIIQPKIEIEIGCENFIPDDFKQNPIEYFEKYGKNIKSGEKKTDETGRVREDPTAVKELPTWVDSTEKELAIIGKRVNPEKGKVAEHQDPFYEAKIMKAVAEVGLPVAKLVATIEQASSHLIIMEKIEGINWHEKSSLELKKKGYTDEDIDGLINQANEQMAELKSEFDQAGIVRTWKLKDMIFDIDFVNKKVLKLTPTDWERTVIDIEKFRDYKQCCGK